MFGLSKTPYNFIALINLVIPIPPPALGKKSNFKNSSNSASTLSFPNNPYKISAYLPSEMVWNMCFISFLSVDLSADPKVSYPWMMTSILLAKFPFSYYFMFQNGDVLFGKSVKKNTLPFS